VYAIAADSSQASADPWSA